MKGIVLALIIGMMGGIWEVAVRPFFPGWAALFPVLPLTVLFLISDPRISRPLACVCIGAIVIDLFSFSSPPFALIRSVAIVLVLDILAHQLLTNRSLYASLGLVLAGRLLERSSGWVFAHAHAWASGPSLFWTGWNDLAFVIGWDLLFVFIGFTFMTYATRRLSGVVRGAATPHPYER